MAGDLHLCVLVGAPDLGKRSCKSHHEAPLIVHQDVAPWAVGISLDQR